MHAIFNLHKGIGFSSVVIREAVYLTTRFTNFQLNESYSILVFQHKLEAGFLALGQLESSLDELLNWMNRTEKALSEQRPVMGDTKGAEIELAKHKVREKSYSGSVLMESGCHSRFMDIFLSCNISCMTIKNEKYMSEKGRRYDHDVAQQKVRVRKDRKSND